MHDVCDWGTVNVMPETLYAIDGHSQIFRAYYAPFRDLTSPTGEPTRATYVFTNMLLKFIAEMKPTHLVMAVDGPAKDLKRRALYSEYKITRKPVPEDFFPQEKRIFEIVEAMGVPILRAEGYEADDILATLAERYASKDLHVVLISRDKDLDQLVGPNVVIYDPMKDETIDAAGIEAKKGYPPEKAIEVQMLTGDSIDNIPGIPGVGPKTAVKLIGKYGSARAVVAAADEQTPKLKENLKANAGKLELSRKLLMLSRDVPLEIDLEQLKFESPDLSSLRPIFAELGFTRLLEKIQDLPSESPAKETATQKTETDEVKTASNITTAADFDYQLIDTPEALEKVAKALKGVTRLAVDTETTGLRPMWCSLVGISLAWEAGKGVYISLAGPLGARVLELETVQKALGKILADKNVEKIGQHLKYDKIVLENAGVELRGKAFDTMIAAHVLDSSRPTYKLDALAMEFLHHKCIPITEVIGVGRQATTMDCVPTDTVAIYAAEDADVTFRLSEILRPALEEESLTGLFENLEMPLMPVLAEMERTGIKVHPQTLKAMEVELSGEADILREKIIAAAGREFNPDSPKQLSEVLFEEMELPVLKKTKTGASTDSSVLEQLAGMCDSELPGLVLDYRKLTKLVRTYLVGLGECIHPKTHRVHTSFHQASVATGRLSSSDPNLQNIPIRTEQGRQIRSAFIAEKGWRLLSADYSQVELRMLGHFCRDETLLETFANDLDIHRIVAAEVFGVPLDQVTPEQRNRAKTVNFGIIYGQTGFGLARTLRISRTEANTFIKQYRARFPKIDDFLKTCVAQAKSNGYVETIFGRRRRIAEIDSPNPQRRAAAERLAINSVVQGSAADLIKQAMINIAARIAKENRPSRMLLQIHDELVFEIPEQDIDSEREMIVAEMTGAIELAVPLKVDVGVGSNWLEAK